MFGRDIQTVSRREEIEIEEKTLRLAGWDYP